MKNLEERILKKIYRFETKKTLAELLLRAGAIVAAVALTVAFGLSVYQQLRQQQTLDLLELFGEDTETIRSYLKDISSTFYMELPKREFAVSLLALLAGILLVLIFVKNYEKIKKKVIALFHFWLKS